MHSFPQFLDATVRHFCACLIFSFWFPDILNNSSPQNSAIITGKCRDGLEHAEKSEISHYFTAFRINPDFNPFDNCIDRFNEEI